MSVNSLRCVVTHKESGFGPPPQLRPRGASLLQKEGCTRWRNLEEVEFATLEWVDWFNHRRLLEPIGNIPPVELEQLYYEKEGSQAMGAGLN
jgi:transposase InsO family protein